MIKRQDNDRQDVIDKMYFYVKDPNEAKYQHLIRKQEILFLDCYEEPESLIEYQKMCRMSMKILMTTVWVRYKKY